MRSVTGILSSLRRNSGGLEADGHNQLLQIMNDPLIKPVQLRPFLVLQSRISREWFEQAGSKRSIDFFEEFQEHQADGISFRKQAVPTGLRDLLHQPLGTELGKIIP